MYMCKLSFVCCFVYLNLTRTQQSLDEYRGSGEDEESNAMQKMVLVSLCSKIMEVHAYIIHYTM